MPRSRKPKTRRHLAYGAALYIGGRRVVSNTGKDYAPKPPPLDGTTYTREGKGHGWTTSRRRRTLLASLGDYATTLRLHSEGPPKSTLEYLYESVYPRRMEPYPAE